MQGQFIIIDDEGGQLMTTGQNSSEAARAAIERVAELLGAHSLESERNFARKIDELIAIGANALRSEEGLALAQERREGRMTFTDFYERLATLIDRQYPQKQPPA